MTVPAAFPLAAAGMEEMGTIGPTPEAIAAFQQPPDVQAAIYRIGTLDAFLVETDTAPRLQGIFGRMDFVYEFETAEKDHRLIRPDELDEQLQKTGLLNYTMAIDFPMDKVAGFFSLAGEDLTEGERWLRDALQREGIVVKAADRWEAAKKSVILGFSQDMEPKKRERLSRHETDHVLFHLIPAYTQAVAEDFSDRLTDAEREVADAFLLAWGGYDVRDPVLRVKEYSAYFRDEESVREKWTRRVQQGAVPDAPEAYRRLRALIADEQGEIKTEWLDWLHRTAERLLNLAAPHWSALAAGAGMEEKKTVGRSLIGAWGVTPALVAATLGLGSADSPASPPQQFPIPVEQKTQEGASPTGGVGVVMFMKVITIKLDDPVRVQLLGERLEDFMKRTASLIELVESRELTQEQGFGMLMDLMKDATEEKEVLTQSVEGKEVRNSLHPLQEALQGHAGVDRAKAAQWQELITKAFQKMGAPGDSAGRWGWAVWVEHVPQLTRLLAEVQKVAPERTLQGLLELDGRMWTRKQGIFQGLDPQKQVPPETGWTDEVLRTLVSMILQQAMDRLKADLGRGENPEWEEIISLLGQIRERGGYPDQRLASVAWRSSGEAQLNSIAFENYILADLKLLRDQVLREKTAGPAELERLKTLLLKGASLFEDSTFYRGDKVSGAFQETAAEILEVAHPFLRSTRFHLREEKRETSVAQELAGAFLGGRSGEELELAFGYYVARYRIWLAEWKAHHRAAREGKVSLTSPESILKQVEQIRTEVEALKRVVGFLGLSLERNVSWWVRADLDYYPSAFKPEPVPPAEGTDASSLSAAGGSTSLTAGMEETGEEVKRLLSDFFARPSRSQRLELLSQQLPGFAPQQRIQFLHGLLWVNDPARAGQLLADALIQENAALARTVRDQILQTAADDSTGDSLLILGELFQGLPEADAVPTSLALSKVLAADNRWSQVAGGLLISAGDANIEAVLRRLEKQAADDPSEPEPYVRMAELFQMKIAAYRGLQSVVFDALSNAEIPLYNLSHRIAGELYLRRAIQEREAPDPGEILMMKRMRDEGVSRLQGEYRKLRAVFDRALAASPRPIYALLHLRRLARLEELYGTYLSLAPGPTGVETLVHLNEAAGFRRQFLELKKERREALDLGGPAAGMEEDRLPLGPEVGAAVATVRQAVQAGALDEPPLGPELGALAARVGSAEEARALIESVASLLDGNEVAATHLLARGNVIADVDGIPRRMETFWAGQGEGPTAEAPTAALPVYVQRTAGVPPVVPDPIVSSMVDQRWNLQPWGEVNDALLQRIQGLPPGPPQAMFLVNPVTAEWLKDQLGWDAPAVIVAIRPGSLDGASALSTMEYILSVVEQARRLGRLVYHSLEGTIRLQNELDIYFFNNV